MSESFFEQNKIFIRRVSNKIIAAYDSDFLYATHTLYCAFQHKKDNSIILTEEDLKSIAILLNSDFYTKMYITLFPFKGVVFPEIRTTKIRMLIFSSISVIRENLKGINDCVINKIIKQKELTEIIDKMLRNNN